MIHPTDQTAAHRSVRDGQGAPVVCAACGCRLETFGDGRFLHYGRLGGRDARGCRIDCAEIEHDRSGRPLMS
jgi:hypothetical protein